ncbi:Protein CBG20849 [Caenorhabditis briggsae]|uniref:Protein CBG20849 n=1 Tax=Caenorhabditis briggsae TaxID=6238 RepID=A8XYS4_CAEBR|nr:Protein CBG20849 [Caenorhabditis briggsae]CAP37790.2 Protein CBG20849 [Caenorhabditis briggsae]
MDLSLIREENTLLVEDSQIQSTSAAAPTTQLPNTLQAEEQQPWYEKIFGGKMTRIEEESMSEDDIAATILPNIVPTSLILLSNLPYNSDVEV